MNLIIASVSSLAKWHDVRGILNFAARGELLLELIMTYSRVQFSCAITFYFLVSVHPVSANDTGVSRDQAIEIAKQELSKATPDPARYEIYVDEDNNGWRGQMSLLRESSSKSSQDLFRKYNPILEGRHYWTIFLVGKTPDGRYPKDDGFTVIIDKGNGKVLFFIPGG